MDTYLSAQDLDLMAQSVQKGTFEGYPAASNRLTFRNSGLYVSNGVLIVPKGLWHVSGHENRLTASANQLHPEVPSKEYPIMPAALSRQWAAEGLMLDQYGRPVHPYWRQLLADERIGLPTGLGYFYKAGWNRTVDAFVYRVTKNGTVEVLLILRKIEREWALPGGFEDLSDKSVHHSARREVKEEATLPDIDGTSEVVLQKVTIGQRTTLNAWTGNTVVIIHGNQEYLFDTTPQANDDAIDVCWASVSRALQLVTFNTHAYYIREAAKHILLS